MRHQRYLATLITLAAATAIAATLTAIPATAQTETVLHSFKGTDGISPALTLVFDSAGNLYGVAAQGGSSNHGSVFELTPGSKGGWTEKTLLSFNGGSGGSTPVGGVIVDSSGNLYGTTKLGGAKGMGVAFKLSRSSSGVWTEKVLHSFGSGKDGQYPTASLVLDSESNLYGTTEGGGAFGNGTESTGGTAFKLAPGSSGSWTETVIHSFGNGTDGAVPRANLITDSNGNLYGTTTLGGAFSVGTAFELKPQSGGGWKETILHNFNPAFNNNQTDGYKPYAGLTFDHSGNLFGTTVLGGYSSGGVVFELSPAAGSWTETILYSFNWLSFETAPYSGVVFDASGHLYGTVIGKPNYPDIYGVVYKLTPQTGTFWIENDLYGFDRTHGAEPGVGYLAIDSSGNLYGATQFGGANQDGVVFKVTP